MKPLRELFFNATYLCQGFEEEGTPLPRLPGTKPDQPSD